MYPRTSPAPAVCCCANQINNTQPKDGTVIGLINRGIPFEPLLGGINTHFDPLKLNFVGSPDRDTAVCAANKNAPVQTVKALYEKELIVGATGSGADTEVYPSFLKNLLGMKFKIVAGYTGSREILLALERGEVQGICVSYDTLARENIFKNGTLRLLFQAALKPNSRLIDVPFAVDLAKTERERQALDLFLARTNLGRPFIAPPGVPANRTKMLQSAFAQTIANPSLIQEAEAAGLHPLYISRRRSAEHCCAGLQGTAGDRRSHQEGDGALRYEGYAHADDFVHHSVRGRSAGGIFWQATAPRDNTDLANTCRIARSGDHEQ